MAPKSRLRRELEADLFRALGSASTTQIVMSALLRRCFRPIFTLRVCQAAARSRPWRWSLPFLILMHRVARHLAGLDLPWATQIAAGLRIDHGWSIVINAGAKIGSNVTLFHGDTLGQRDRISPDGSRITEYPVIEDDVWIGPHAVIVGGVLIGRGSRIGAGAFVADSIPPCSLVIGNPARVVHEAIAPDGENRWSAESA